MIYTGIILLLFSIILLFRSVKNRLAWCVSLLIWGFILLTFSSILLITKSGLYIRPVNILFFLDFKLYILLMDIKVTLSTILRIFNFGVAIYLISINFIMHYFDNSLYPINPPFVKVKFCLMFLVPLSYVIFYDPQVSYVFYINVASRIIYNINSNSISLYIINTMDLVIYIGIIFLLFSTVLSLIKHYRFIDSRFIKNQDMSLAITLIILNLFYIFAFISTGIRKPYFTYDTIHHFLPASLVYSASGMYYIFPFIILVVSTSLLFILVKYRGFDATSFFKRFFVRKRLKTVKINYRSVFHSFKNTLLAIRFFSERAKNEYGDAECEKTLQNLYEYTNSSIDNISRIFDSMKDVRIMPLKCNIISCIEEALNKESIYDKIDVSKDYTSNSIWIYGDNYHLNEAFANILKNASEAIDYNGHKDGLISISVFAHMEWVVIKIADNGCGIRKSDLKKIFKPFYSTKSMQENWGIGLHYALNVIKAHLGFIEVISSESKGTTFEILLPNIERSELIE